MEVTIVQLLLLQSNPYNFLIYNLYNSYSSLTLILMSNCIVFSISTDNVCFVFVRSYSNLLTEDRMVSNQVRSNFLRQL